MPALSRVVGCVLVLALATVAGCSPKPAVETKRQRSIAEGAPRPLIAGGGDTAAGGRTPEKDLADLGVYLGLQCQRNPNRPPNSVRDFTVLQEKDAKLYAAVETGTYVVRWGRCPKAFGEAVTAYERDAPTEGGLVLLGLRTVKKLKADEFAAALNKPE
jgi:hypothetical protein